MPQFDKARALEAFVAQLRHELEMARAYQKLTEAGATHEESRAENDKDTRAVEASYLARGQAPGDEVDIRTLKASVNVPS